jgi:hypothetical protein
MVGASGFEPPASWSRNKSATSRKALPRNSHSENKALSSQDGMCAAVSRCVRLIVGSLQKPLQRVGLYCLALYIRQNRRKHGNMRPSLESR